MTGITAVTVAQLQAKKNSDKKVKVGCENRTEHSGYVIERNM
jgi:hypothetical protein